MSKHVALVTVADLLMAEGFTPRFTYTGVSNAVWLAEMVAYTIASPLGRMAFRCLAARDIMELDHVRIEPHAAWLAAQAATVEQQAPTPLGSVEVWGNFLQRASI